MDYQITYPEVNTAVIAATIAKEDWDKALTEIKETYKDDNPDALRQYAITYFAGRILGEAIGKDKLRLADTPAILANDNEDGSVSITLTCNLVPDVKLGQYVDFGIKNAPVIVTDQEVMEEINNRINAQKLWTTVDRPAVNGDRVMINFVGEKDGVAFPGGSGENYGLVLGSQTFIPGFEEQLIGTKAGESKDVNVTFPDTYFEASLAGQPVVFHVTVNAVQEEVKPELTDAFLQRLGIEGVSTVAEFREKVAAEMKSVKEQEAENKLLGEVMDKIASESEVEIPQVMINNQLDQMVDQYKANLQQYGMNFEQYLQMMNSTEEQFRKMMEPQAVMDIRSALILEAIATKENIKAEKTELDEEYNLLSKVYNMPAEQLKSLIPEAAVATQIVQKKTLDFLKDKNIDQ